MSISTLPFSSRPPSSCLGHSLGPNLAFHACKTATMQNGAVGVMGDCIHTPHKCDPVQPNPGIESLFNSVSMQTNTVCISGQQIGAGRNRGGF